MKETIHLRAKKYKPPDYLTVCGKKHLGENLGEVRFATREDTAKSYVTNNMFVFCEECFTPLDLLSLVDL